MGPPRATSRGVGQSPTLVGSAGHELRVSSMGDSKLRIMLVDDHYLVRVGLTSVIALEPDMTVCTEAATGEQAIASFRVHRPDVTLMDLRLPVMSGLEATQTIRAEFPDARIIMLSTYGGDEEIYAGL